MPLLFGDVNEATVRVLRRNGCDVVLPKNQICCGALNVHNGESVAARTDGAAQHRCFSRNQRRRDRRQLRRLRRAMKEYGYLLRDDPAYRDKARAFQRAGQGRR